MNPMHTDEDVRDIVTAIRKVYPAMGGSCCPDKVSGSLPRELRGRE